MWRLKVGEGANDPYLYSTNNFVGRQTWKFDPNYGTPEEREEVEEARRNFYNNRFKVKPCGDLIWRLQVHMHEEGHSRGSQSKGSCYARDGSGQSNVHEELKQLKKKIKQQQKVLDCVMKLGALMCVIMVIVMMK